MLTARVGAGDIYLIFCAPGLKLSPPLHRIPFQVCGIPDLGVFDLESGTWVARYELPGYEEFWKYTCPHAVSGSYLLLNLSTFQGVPNEYGSYGFDGKPHHFVNKLMVFDTRDNSAGFIDVPSLSGTGYTTVAYYATLGESIYGSCVDSALNDSGTPREHGLAYLVRYHIEP